MCEDAGEAWVDQPSCLRVHANEAISIRICALVVSGFVDTTAAVPEQHHTEIDLNDLTALLLAGVIRVQSRARSLRAVAGVLFQPRGQFGVQTLAASGGHCMQSIQERQH
jgi:hypothetical protein